jgi:hypothetical protein
MPIRFCFGSWGLSEIHHRGPEGSEWKPTVCLLVGPVSRF